MKRWQRHAIALQFPALICMAYMAGCDDDLVHPRASDAAANPDGLPSTSDISNTSKSGLTLTSLTPARGPMLGGDQVALSGKGFGPQATVMFDGRAAEVVWRSGTTGITVVAPPAAVPGPVAVRVANSKADLVELARGYTYLADVQVHGFTPELGPFTGGTPITVRGSGFNPGDRILVGYLEAAANKVLDSSTIVAITPPAYAIGEQDLAKAIVSVRHASGVTNAAQTFTYGRPPRIDKVLPPIVSLAGGAMVAYGAGLGNITQLYAAGAPATLAPGTAGSARGATVPPLPAGGAPGPAELLAQSHFGDFRLFPAFAYVDPALKSPQFWAVQPASGPTTGGTQVVLVAALPEGAKVTALRFDGKDAVFQQAGTAVTATAPGHAAGTIAVELVTTQGSAKLDAGFTYVAQLAVAKLQPDAGPTAGGTQSDVKGTGFQTGCKVRIGSWPAKVVKVSADSKVITVITPPGAPGAADVTVDCFGQEAVLGGGFSYSDGELHINAVLPNSSATSGQTLVKLLGSGFKKGMQAYFGGKPALSLAVLSAGQAEVKVPPGQPGTVSVDVVWGQAVDTLIDGFSYYSPANPHGGTWGEGVQGALNVTVLNIYSLQPIEGAFVQLGQPGEGIYPKYNGKTDAKGQIVFSGPDIAAPVTVSATKASFTASAIVSFDAKNATLLLFPHVPPSPGSGQPPAPLPLAELRGHVLDLDKYVAVPPGNCLKSEIAGDLTCSACKTNEDCGGGPGGSAAYVCADNGIAGQRCLQTCKKKADCGKAWFSCSADPALGVGVCKPDIGIRKVLCATTVRSIEAPNPPPSSNAVKGPQALWYDAAIVDETTGEFVISSRLDELAIVCVGGYVANATKKFVPTTMGVRRHVFPKPGDVLTGLDVKLNIPLRRTLPLRLDHPQKFVAGTNGKSVGGALRIHSWVDLGSDGLVRLSEIQQLPTGGTSGIGAAGTGVADDVDLPYQPVSLPKELTEGKYVFYARAEFSDGAEMPPLTATLHDDLQQPGDGNLLLRGPDGKQEFGAIDVDQDLTAIVAGPDGKVLVVARSGRLYLGPADHPSLVYVPPVVDPYAPPTLVLAAGGTPTDATVVGEGGLVRRFSAGKVTQETGALGGFLRGVCHGPLGRIAVGDGGGVQVDTGAGWQKVFTGTTVTLRGVACTGAGGIAVGDGGAVVEVMFGSDAALAKLTKPADGHLHAVAVDPAGAVWIAGDGAQGQGPTLLWRTAGSSAWVSAWPKNVVPSDPNTGLTWPGLRALVPLVAGTVLVADAEGGIRRVGPDGTNNESPPRRDLRPRHGARLPDGTVAFVGQPGLWLGPFLTIADIVKPFEDQNPSALPLEWVVAPGPLPSATRVHLDGSGFPYWWVYVAPTVTKAVLPDFAVLSAIQVFPVGVELDYRVRIDRIYAPSLHINGFSTFDLEFGDWRSWSSNRRAFRPK
jgi:hypothetical protein